MTEAPHISILVKEWLELLEGREIHRYLDGTLGAGGHALEVLKAHPEICTFYGVDQDKMALEIAKKRLAPWQEKMTYLHSNFVKLGALLKGEEKLDAMLFDLGVSSMQLDLRERGFSFMGDGPLDMRMNQEAELSAKEIVATWSEEELGRIFRDLGEERFWRRAAKEIALRRKEAPIETTEQLVRCLMPVFPWHQKGSHPLTRIFQALRIAVNSELDVLKSLLPQVVQALKPGGVVGFITFHSLEDRIVKQFFQQEASDKVTSSGLSGLFLEKEPTLTLLTRKALQPGEEEIAKNPRSRSAKLRAAERK